MMSIERRFVLSQKRDFNQSLLALWGYGKAYTVWLFEGTLGSGKTTLVKALCAHLGCGEDVSSPSFALIHRYIGLDKQPIYHMDMYRLRLEGEASELGLDEYFVSGAYCFVEWAERVRMYWPLRYLHVRISALSVFERALLVRRIG